VEFEIVHARELVAAGVTAAQTELMGRIARYDLVRGAYGSGARLYRIQLERYRSLYGEIHPDTVAAMSNLAGACFVTSDFAGARALHEDVLRIRRETLGEEHSDTLTAMSNLAATLSIDGDLEGARHLQKEMLSIRERMHGKEHPKTTAAAWNLFLTLTETADQAAAGELFATYLAWLLEREPSGLVGEQRRIRDAAAEMAVRNRTLRARTRHL
jgi:Tetratricopeptide repeat